MTNLPRGGREYFRWEFTGLPTDHGTVEALIGGSWHPLTMDGSTGGLLLAGPDADPSGAVVVTDDVRVQIRVTDNPEIIVRSGGRITLSDN